MTVGNTTVQVSTERDDIELSSLLYASITIESINEGMSITKLRNLFPKSEFENELLRMLKRYPPELSFVTYMYFEKIAKITYKDSKEDVQTFFLDMEIIYILNFMLEKYHMDQSDIIKFFKGFSSLGKFYSKTIKNIHIFFSNKDNSGIPSKENMLSYLRTFHSFMLGSDIKQAVKEAAELKDEFYKDNFLKKNLSNIREMILEESMDLLDTKFTQKQDVSKKPFIISLNPPLWTNAQMDCENILTGFLATKLGKEAYQEIKTKNLFYYFLTKSERQKKEYLSKKITEIILANEISSKRILNSMSQIMSGEYKDKAVQELVSYINIKQLENETIDINLNNIFNLDTNEDYSEKNLTDSLLGSIYQAAMMFAFDSQNYLFYDEDIYKDKQVVLKLAEIINNNLNNRQYHGY